MDLENSSDDEVEIHSELVGKSQITDKVFFKKYYSILFF